MILKSTHFFQSLALGAEGGGVSNRDSTVYLPIDMYGVLQYQARTPDFS